MRRETGDVKRETGEVLLLKHVSANEGFNFNF